MCRVAQAGSKTIFLLQDTWTSSTEPQDSGPSALEEALHPQTEPSHPDGAEHTVLQPQLDPATSPASDLNPPPGPGPVEVCCPPPAPLPSDSPPSTDCSAQAKKKKGFFSKGKKLFRKLGSSKKDWQTRCLTLNTLVTLEALFLSALTC